MKPLKVVRQKLVFVRRKKSELHGTPEDVVRDRIFETAVKAAQQSAYAAGTTDLISNIASKVGAAIDIGTIVGAGGQASRSFAATTYKGIKDLARGDTLCTGLCTVSATCELVCVACTTIKVIPFRGQIYASSKVLSMGCIHFRNICAGEGC